MWDGVGVCKVGDILSMGIFTPGMKMLPRRVFNRIMKWEGLEGTSRGYLVISGLVLLAWRSLSSSFGGRECLPTPGELAGSDAPLSWISAPVSPWSIKRGSGLSCKVKPWAQFCGRKGSGLSDHQLFPLKRPKDTGQKQKRLKKEKVNILLKGCNYAR